MNPDIPNPREGLETKLTALLLGELPADQAESLQAAIAQNAELAKLYGRLKETISLVRETESSHEGQFTSNIDALKLSPDKREKLLAQFKTVAPKEFLEWPLRKREWFVPASAAAIIIGMALVILSTQRSHKFGVTPLSSRVARVDDADTSLHDAQPAASSRLEYHGKDPSTLTLSAAGPERLIENARGSYAKEQSSSTEVASPAPGGRGSEPAVLAKNQLSTIVLPSDAKSYAPIPLPHPGLALGVRSAGLAGESASSGAGGGGGITTVAPSSDESAFRRRYGLERAVRGGTEIQSLTVAPSVAPVDATTGSAGAKPPNQVDPISGLLFANANPFPGLKQDSSGLTKDAVGALVQSSPVPESKGKLRTEVPAEPSAGESFSTGVTRTEESQFESLSRKSEKVPMHGDIALLGKEAQAGSESSGKDLVRNGRQLSEPGRLDDAEVRLKQEISKNPQNQATHYSFNFANEARNRENLNYRDITSSRSLAEPSTPVSSEMLAMEKAVRTREENRALGFDWYLGNQLAGKGAKENQPLVDFDSDPVKDASKNLYSLNSAGYVNATNVSAATPQFRSFDGTTGSVLQFEPSISAVDKLASKSSESDFGVQLDRPRSLSEQPKVSETLEEININRDDLSRRKLMEAAKGPSAAALAKSAKSQEAAQKKVDILGTQINQAIPSAHATVITDFKGRQFITNKLAHIRLNGLNYDGLPLAEVIKHLGDESKKHDPEERGINFIINPNVTPAETKIPMVEPATGLPVPGAIPEPIDVGAVMIKTNFPRNKVRLTDALDAIVKAANGQIRYSIEDYGVVFSPAVEAKTIPNDVVQDKASKALPVPQPEVATGENAFSTFSLNVSDVSFKLAGASLEKGQMPEPASIRSEEFINAFDYRDPEPVAGAPVAFAWERARYPFAHNRDVLRFSIKTAAAGRQAGRPLNIVLLLDNSGSMERADRVRIIREALRVLATQLQPQDKLSVITFARTPRLWLNGVAGDQAGKVAEEVSGLTPQGGTNLEEAMNLAYQTAARHYLPNGINRVVLLTDGAANLGDVAPESLKQKVEAQRKQGIALDCFGIGWEGFNDDLLEILSRNGDGRYGFINTLEEAATEFAGQLAGALHVAASDVKVQVEFNPDRITAYRQIGYAKHQLTKEQFRDNAVDAAEVGAAESGNALYVIETNPAGQGPLATVRVRFKVPGTSDYREHEWAVPFTGNAAALEYASPAMRLAATASAFSEWLVSSPYAGEITPDRLLGYLSGVPDVYGADARPKKLEWMIRQAKSVAGK